MKAMQSETDEERYARIRAVRDELDNLPDAAFFAAAELRGITNDDWLFFANYLPKRP